MHVRIPIILHGESPVSFISSGGGSESLFRVMKNEREIIGVIIIILE